MHKCVYTHIYVRVLVYMVVTLIFEEPSSCYPLWRHRFVGQSTVSKYSLSFLYNLTRSSDFLMTAILETMGWYQLVVLIPSSRIMNETTHFSMCLINSLCLLKEKKLLRCNCGSVGPLWFHMNFKMCFSIYVNSNLGLSEGTALNLYVTCHCGHSILSFSIWNGMSHLFVSPLISLPMT